MFEVTILYSEDAMRVAARRFFLRFILRDLVIAAVIILFGLALTIGWGVKWHYAAGFCLVAFALVALVSLAGWRYIRNSLARFRSLTNPTIGWHFSNEVIGAKSEQTSNEFKWNMVSKVWRFPEVWLLFFGGAGYSVSPVSGLTSEIKEFIVAQVQATGGNVA
jgi:hypothetical protein